MQYTIDEIIYYLGQKTAILTTRQAEFTSVFTAEELEKEIAICFSAIEKLQELKKLIGEKK